MKLMAGLVVLLTTPFTTLSNCLCRNLFSALLLAASDSIDFNLAPITFAFENTAVRTTITSDAPVSILHRASSEGTSSSRNEDTAGTRA